MMSFGDWVRRQRKFLDMTQVELAGKVNCSVSMLRKIEGDERRPSSQLARLLFDHLAIDDTQWRLFSQLARGQYTPLNNMPVNSTEAAAVGALPLPVEEVAPFVGREGELEQLHQYLAEAIAGRGRLVFIAGEAGRGKTSLLNEFARQAIARRPEVIVAGGSCDIYLGRGVPLLPFRDIFRLLTVDWSHPGLSGLVNEDLAERLVRSLPLVTEILLNQGSPLLDTIVPSEGLADRLIHHVANPRVRNELLARIQDLRGRRPLPFPIERRQERLFEEIASTLDVLARQRPLVLLVDDLHWVDHSSAGLLTYMIRRLGHTPILIVGGYRPEDSLEKGQTERLDDVGVHPLAELLGESRRQFGHNRLDLDLAIPEKHLAFINALLDREENAFDEDFRNRLAGLTAGHPLFVVELLKDMQEKGDIEREESGRWRAAPNMTWDHLPARVEGVIEKRLSRISRTLRDILAIGSVQGEIFYAEVVAQVGKLDVRELTRHLNSSLKRRHRLIQDQGIRQMGLERLTLYRFRHQLFQKYLYGRLGPAERMYLHEDVGQALERLFAGVGDSREIPAAQLAHHFEEARRLLQASRYHLLAGQQAAVLAAYEEAIDHFEHGLSLLPSDDRAPKTERLRYELTFHLAHATWFGGRLESVLSAYQAAIDIARRLGDPEALAQAVLAYEQPRWRLNLPMGPSEQNIREALAALGDKESAQRVRLLVFLARSLLGSNEQMELHDTVAQALDIARRIRDPQAILDALRYIIQVDRRPASATRRLAAIDEMIATARAIDDRESLADGLGLYMIDHLELGHIDLVDRMLSQLEPVIAEIQQPFHLHVLAQFKTMRAILKGQFQLAEQLAYEAADVARRFGLGELDGILGIHLFTIRWQQGRLMEIAPAVKAIAAHNPASAFWRPGLAVIYAAIGELELCREIFAGLAGNSFADIPPDSMRSTTLAYLAEACVFLGDRARAALLHDLLLPYAGRTILVGSGVACYGAAARYLGMLAALQEDWERAERHFAEAIELETQMGARPWRAQSQYRWAAMLLARGNAADRPRAAALLGEAAAAAAELDMKILHEQAAALREQHRVQ